MTDEPERLWQGWDQLFIHPPGDADTRKGTVDGHHAIQSTAPALVDELGAVAGFRGHEFGEAGEVVPFLTGGSTVEVESARAVFGADATGLKRGNDERQQVALGDRRELWQALVKEKYVLFDLPEKENTGLGRGRHGV